MEPLSPPYRHLLRALAVVALGGYVLVMSALVREDMRLTFLSDALELKRREVDAQLVQNEREMHSAKKRSDDLLLVLRDLRRDLTAQGLQVTQEANALQVRRALWAGIYWPGVAFAHIFILPLFLWALSAAHWGGFEPPARRKRGGAGTRKRAPRTKTPATPKLVEG